MNTTPNNPISLIVYCAHAGDHNELAMHGALAVGAALSRRLGIPVTTIGAPDTALNADWKTELAAASATLLAFADHLDGLFKNGLVPLSVLSRCAASLGTLPVLMRHHPDACVVWLDAHGDLNTPQTTLTGYLGGMSLAGPAGLWDSGLGNGLPLTNTILVGTRDLDPAEQVLVSSGKVKLIPPKGNYLAELRAAIAGRPAYIHLDCDVLEPGIVPTDFRVQGGFALTDLHSICQILAEGEIIGLEIAEFENSWTKDSAAVSPYVLLDALDPVVSRIGTHGHPARDKT